MPTDRHSARLHLLITGRVQGVGFRFAAVDEARSLALTGWVRNTPDGQVEIVAEGSREALKAMVAWAHQGPRLAGVSEVEEQWAEYKGEFRDFQIH